MPVDATSIPAAIADYRILGMIGQGNHGRFYLAEPPDRLGLAADRVALKVFHAAVDADAYRRGVRELRAFAAVRSPRLVEIYDVVLEENFFYAMEYFPSALWHYLPVSCPEPKRCGRSKMRRERCTSSTSTALCTVT